jgi:hypothetical protein
LHQQNRTLSGSAYIAVLPNIEPKALALKSFSDRGLPGMRRKADHTMYRTVQRVWQQRNRRARSSGGKNNITGIVDTLVKSTLKESAGDLA